MNNLEFFNSPNGKLYYQRDGKMEELTQSSIEVVDALLEAIKKTYGEAFDALVDEYKVSEANVVYYKFRIVSRFVRCNFGELDTMKIDFDIDNHLNVEQVKCPLRGSGDCPLENIVCCPKMTAEIGERQLELVKNLAAGLSNQEIADRMMISISTVHNVIAALKVKLQLKDTRQLVTWYNNKYR